MEVLCGYRFCEFPEIRALLTVHGMSGVIGGCAIRPLRERIDPLLQLGHAERGRLVLLAEAVIRGVERVVRGLVDAVHCAEFLQFFLLRIVRPLQILIHGFQRRVRGVGEILQFSVSVQFRVLLLHFCELTG